jgi:hypothetical protein
VKVNFWELAQRAHMRNAEHKMFEALANAEFETVQGHTEAAKVWLGEADKWQAVADDYARALT